MTTIKALAERIIETYKSERLSGFREVSPEYRLATAVLSLWKDSERLVDIVNDCLGQINEASLQTFLQMERHRNEDHGLYMNYKITYELMKVKADEIKEALAAHEKLLGELK